MTQGLTGIQLALFEDEVQLLETAKKKTCYFTALAEKLQTQIALRWEQANRKCNTHRKAEQADAAMYEWHKLTIYQGWLKGVAYGWETNTLPGCLLCVGKEQLELLLNIKMNLVLGHDRFKIEEVFTKLDYSDWRTTLRKARITTLESLQGVLATLDKMFSLPPAKEQMIQQKMLERKLIGCDIPGYFPTPTAIAEIVVDKADLKAGMSVLEPSAGKGNLARVIIKHPVALDVIECQYSLRKILELQEFNLIAHDFLEYIGQYDRVVMNPPFEDGEHIRHIRHAYACLVTGGRLVAIVPRGFGNKRGKLYEEFTQWLRDKQAQVESLPDNAFRESDRPTGVQTCMVVIDRN